MDYNPNDQPDYIWFVDLYLEISKSDKAKCRKCNKNIGKNIKRWKTSERDKFETNYVSNRYYHENCLPPEAGHPAVSYHVKTQTGEMKKLNKMPTDPHEILLFQNVVQNYVEYRKKYDITHKPYTDDSDYDEPVKKVKKDNFQHQKAAGKNNALNDADLAIQNDFQALVEKLKNEYKDKKINKLKDELKKNCQRVSGTNQEIFERVADGRLLGILPKCLQCGVGFLRYDNETEVYTCPGYYSYEIKYKCGAQFDSDQINRKPWKK